MSNKFYKIKLFMTFLFVYVVLFELIFPVNNFLPKPSSVVESFEPLMIHYSLLIHLSTSISILLIGIFIGYFLFFVVSRAIINIDIIENVKIHTSYISIIPLSFMLIGFFKLWNLDAILFEFLFAAVSISSMLLLEFMKFAKKSFPKEYFHVLANLKMNKSSLLNSIMIKSFLPNLIKNFNSIFSTYFLVLIIYEAVVNFFGVGSLFMHLFENKDLSGFSASLILLIVTYLIIRYLFNIFIKKLIYWDGIDE